MRPDERIFHAHVEGATFLMGQEDGRWRLHTIQWPNAVIIVQAAARPQAPGSFAFRFDLSGYPNQAPTARLWDAAAGIPLSAKCFPTGPPGSRVALAFRTDWQQGAALYLPCDRVGLQSHSNWREQYPRLAWRPDKDITFFLNILYGLLHSSHYKGIRGA